MTSAPKFEFPEDHEFVKGEHIYVIDKNKHDIWQALIKKVGKNGYIVHFEDNDDGDKKFPKTKRFLLRTETNNAIYEDQAKQRQEKESESEESESPKPEELSPPNEEEEKPKRKRAKKDVVFDKQAFVLHAWDSGIREKEAFVKYMSECTEDVVAEFERYYKIKNVDRYPPFTIGGELKEKNLSNFWETCKIQWKGICGNVDSVPTKVFLSKAPNAYKLPNQSLSNARAALKFIFDPETSETTDFIQFCAFLAMFGPAQSAIRKIGAFLKCPENIKEQLGMPDLGTFQDPEINLEDTEMNGFTFTAKDGAERTLYNIPYVEAVSSREPSKGNYLIDDEGTEFESWIDFFRKTYPDDFKEQKKSDDEDEEEKPKKQKKEKKEKKPKKVKKDDEEVVMEDSPEEKEEHESE